MTLERKMCHKSTRAKVSAAAKGRAVDVLAPDALLAYITKRCKAIFNNVNYGLEFVKVERCTSAETVRLLMNRSEKEHDITSSTMFLSRFTFQVGNNKIIQYTYLPYVKDKIFVYISGTPHTIVDVISDKCISPGMSGVFVRYLKNKMNIPFLKYSISRNKLIKEVIVPHTEPLNPRSSNSAPKVPVLWYLLSKYGLRETIKQLHGCSIKIISSDDVDKYTSRDDVTLYSTVFGAHLTMQSVSKNRKGLRVRAAKDIRISRFTLRYRYVNDGGYKDRVPTRIHFIVKNEFATPLMDQTMASLFYVLDVMTSIEGKDLYNLDVIEYIMSIIVFKEPGKTDLNSMRKRLCDKIATLDGHVDQYMQEILEAEFGDTLKEDFSRDGFYKIMKVVYIRYKCWRESARPIVSNVIDKRFEILDYITVPLFKRLNTMNFSMSQAMVNRGVAPDLGTIRNALTKDLTLSIMFGIRSGTPSCTRITYSGDNIFNKHTSTLHLQFNVPSSTGNVKSRKSKKGGKGRADPSTLIHASHPFAGTAVGVAKSRDTGLKYHGLFSPLHPGTHTIVPPKDQILRSKPLEDILSGMANRSRMIDVPAEFARPYVPIDYVTTDEEE